MLTQTTVTTETTTGNNDPQVILFYKYVTIHDPQSIAQWQTQLCTSLKLTGKIILASEGINATLAGDDRSSTDAYIQAMKSHELFCDIDFKESPGRGTIDFEENGLSVRVCDEIITTRFTSDLEQVRSAPCGTHLSPEEFHDALVRERLVLTEDTSDAVGVVNNDVDDVDGGGACLLDVRNFYESRIGKFENAICPPIRAFSQFGEYVDQNLEQFKNKRVYMYCTGGIRCERASAYMRYKGVEQVYQLKGGIHRYIEQFPEGKFRGKNYVFDERGFIKSNDDVIATCDVCKVTQHDIYRFCSSEGCRTIVIACDDCLEKNEGKAYCCPDCEQYGWKYMKVLKQKEHEERMEKMRALSQEKKKQRKANKSCNATDTIGKVSVSS